MEQKEVWMVIFTRVITHVFHVQYFVMFSVQTGKHFYACFHGTMKTRPKWGQNKNVVRNFKSELLQIKHLYKIRVTGRTLNFFFFFT